MSPAKQSVLPQVGDIWLDTKGEHNLIIEEHGHGGVDATYALLTLNTGSIWHNEPLSAWYESAYGGGKPFYIKRVG